MLLVSFLQKTAFSLDLVAFDFLMETLMETTESPLVEERAFWQCSSCCWR